MLRHSKNPVRADTVVRPYGIKASDNSVAPKILNTN